MNADVIKVHFQRKPGFPDLYILLQIAREGRSGTAWEGTGAVHECLRYGNNRSLNEHSRMVLKATEQDLRRGKILIFPRNSAQEIRGVRISQLGAVVTFKKRFVLSSIQP